MWAHAHWCRWFHCCLQICSSARSLSFMSEKPELSVLGQTVRHPIEHVEVFPAPANVTIVKFTTDELASMCPVTQQPDISTLVIEYVPQEFCIESKSLKLYLWGFRDRAVFAEALAAEIAEEVMATARPETVRVVLTQRPRGGIEVEAVAELFDDSIVY